ncbi:NAD-dependent dehydratase [Streptomyces mobaraensis NBRC 13819 = DSM 40847]|uniref:NAD-dependent epimerase/dehydratase n=1 Tax=Streptomyces mobaraensis (strain ATCC 29032 / DSM 40847 / JCM 4168 / NBRC 13819 / NCIMB 11159 / IPCR 16-22) TaxID=1223523 RepID=M3CBN5_STRM1|nr:NAD-dependent epimerase/dehydratase family protein [Streptomyces mobaraensis]EMF01396.1 NAD-dependent epimerase/dehydratase [Streptomyces mobaraensis NBRC 13819 = DSM 40847]QTT72610.1 NAD-dependent dehydratase [Streptomyces mobaraensis NBRC 13819 = DSM 40847]
MPSSGRTSPLRLLVLGGTGFVSGAIAREAVARGHDVTCVARGTGGEPPAGARLLRADRAAPGALDALRGTPFDAAVETATLALPWVREALAAVTAAHWTFVSSISVYADTHTPGQDARTARLRPALPGDTAAYDPARDPEPSQARYGGVKLACEDAVREAAGERAFVVRPGLLTGPGDDVGPFGYWPLRMARGGPTAVPPAVGEAGLPLPAQLLDVRDLAVWILDAAEERTAGTFDAVGPAAALADLLAEVADAVGREPELVPVPEPVLAEAGVRPWTGPHSLPLWPPRELYGALARAASPSADAGLRARPVADTARAVLADRLGRAAGRRPPAGLTPVEEAALLRGMGW